MGSAMMHGTHTMVGGVFDVELMSYFMYMFHQISISNLGNDVVVKNLSVKGRSIDGIQAAEEVT